jgi:hypothetical protein
MAFDPTPIVAAMESASLALGQFERVNTHEPKSSPGAGLTAAIWMETLGPVPEGSGLAQTSGRLEMRERLYTNMLADPQDMIDPRLMTACGLLMGAYSADYTLGGLVRSIDLLGMAGEPMRARAGYLRGDGGKMFRVLDLAVPMVVNDLWEQVP